ncbi:MAG: sugar phosphate isomerase/epimerase [Betaproteobacteria bacterium]|nr:sugar phosphate isomerase/epimerase [Betaproteobacteria bacterium]
MYGVSPAYFISRYSDRFTFDEMATSLSDLSASGFGAFQPEVFHADTLDEWRATGARVVRAAAEGSGLVASQFVAHFLLHAFADPAALTSDFGIAEAEKTLEGLEHFPECTTLTVPLPPFEPLEPQALGVGACAGYRSRLIEKLGRMLELAEGAGRRIALELIPGSLVGGVQGLLRIEAELGRPSLGYNFDTGFAWWNREWVPLVPAQLAGRIFGTHLKDNFRDGQALAPGKGSIPWRETLGALKASAYTGSLDIEFRCGPDRAHQEYQEALGYLKQFKD